MSEIVLLNGRKSGETALPQTEVKPEDKPKQLTRPSGYHVLCMIPQAEETFQDSDIAKADQTKRLEEVGSVVGFVVGLGPDAYTNKEKFPTGPWCKEGDFVLMGAYKGNRFRIHKQEFRMINDDEVLGTVDDPRGYSRA